MTDSTSGPGAGNPAVTDIDALGIHVAGDPNVNVVFVTVPLTVDAAIDLSLRLVAEAAALQRARRP